MEREATERSLRKLISSFPPRVFSCIFIVLAWVWGCTRSDCLRGPFVWSNLRRHRTPVPGVAMEGAGGRCDGVVGSSTGARSRRQGVIRFLRRHCVGVGGWVGCVGTNRLPSCGWLPRSRRNGSVGSWVFFRRLLHRPPHRWKKVFVEACGTHEELLESVRDRLPRLIALNDVRLVVIDSIAALFRSGRFDSCCKDGVFLAVAASLL